MKYIRFAYNIWLSLTYNCTQKLVLFVKCYLGSVRSICAILYVHYTTNQANSTVRYRTTLYLNPISNNDAPNRDWRAFSTIGSVNKHANRSVSKALCSVDCSMMIFNHRHILITHHKLDLYTEYYDVWSYSPWPGESIEYCAHAHTHLPRHQ